MSQSPSLFEVLLKEYDKLKSEQTARIAFRDNLVYVTLSVYGAIIAFAVKEYSFTLLVLPWASIVLGWNYLVNDEKISAIGRHVRFDLSKQVSNLLGEVKAEELFGWETAHRRDRRRRRRKIEQLIVDQTIFVLSGFAALGAFWFADPDARWPFKLVAGLEAVVLAILAIEIVVYADLKVGRGTDSENRADLQKGDAQDVADLQKILQQQLNPLKANIQALSDANDVLAKRLDDVEAKFK
jgi:hypothetical protein